MWPWKIINSVINSISISFDRRRDRNWDRRSLRSSNIRRHNDWRLWKIEVWNYFAFFPASKRLKAIICLDLFDSVKFPLILARISYRRGANVTANWIKREFLTVRIFKNQSKSIAWPKRTPAYMNAKLKNRRIWKSRSPLRSNVSEKRANFWKEKHFF